jgi:hypothetical protein
MLRTLRKMRIGAWTRGTSPTQLSLQLETAIQNWITMALEVNWRAQRRLRFLSRATLRRPVCRPQVQRKVALRTQTPAALIGLIGPHSNHGGSNPSSEGRVSGPGATYFILHVLLNPLYEIANSNWAIQFTGQRMLRPTSSTIRTYACKAADGFSLLHATQPSVATVTLSGRNTTFSCSSFFNCSGTRATPNPAATA